MLLVSGKFHQSLPARKSIQLIVLDRITLFWKKSAAISHAREAIS
jgi:hypothetical protein